MPMTPRKQYFILGAAIIAVLLGIYHHALRIPYFGDDFQWYFPHPAAMLFGNFLHHAPDNEWYRPLQSTVLSAIQLLWGSDTLPIRIWQLLLQFAAALIIYRALRYWKISAPSAIVAALYFSVMQAATFAVICNDTMSQMMGSLFGILTLWILYRGMERVRLGERFPSWRIIISVITFFLALASKETSAGLCLGVFALLWFMEPSKESFARRLGGVSTRIVPFILIGVLYVIMRTTAGSVMPSYGGESVYQIHLGLNIFKNLALFIFQGVLPFSSAAVMHTIYDRNIGSLAIMLLVTCLLGVAWFYGIWKSPKRRLALYVLGMAVFSVIPAIFLNHVSEVYLYNALPYLAVTFGIAVDYFWELAPKASKISFALLLVVVFVTNAIGAIQKTAALAEESDRAQVLMAQMYPIISKLPQDGRLYLVNPVAHAFDYSVFAMKGFEPVMYADPWVLRHTQRPDVEYFVLDSVAYQDSARVHPGFAYTMNMATLRIKPF